MQAADPQSVLCPPLETAVFLVLTVDAGAEDQLRDLLPDVSGLRQSVGFRHPKGDLSCVVRLGSELWDRLFGDPRPDGLHPFVEVAGSTHTAVATPGDVLFHIRSHRFDLCFELAQLLIQRVKGYVHFVDEVHGFKSFDERDLLGFVDGTKNPEGTAAHTAVTISDEDSEFAGGSYVVVQKYVHDLEAWDALTTEAQEQAIGRTKLRDIEMPDDIKPSNSHVALNTIADESGASQQIARFNMPFGNVSKAEFGTYFIGYARNPDVIEQMLRNMFIGKPPGNYDRILDFSMPVTGNLFFVPTAEISQRPNPARADTAGVDRVGNRPGQLFRRYSNDINATSTKGREDART